jgi:pimeloyl-ACP methyl ester carboxylesterase
MKNPIIFVHGYMDNWWTPWWLRNKYLVEKELGRKCSIVRKRNFPLSNVSSFEHNGKYVAQEIDKYSSNVDVLGHSQGGLDARWAIERLGREDCVDNLITLGTPHEGTELAQLGYFSSGGRHMLPESDALSKLNADETPDSCDYYCFWSDRDELVQPRENAKLESAENYRISESHFTMQSNVLEKLSKTLL